MANPVRNVLEGLDEAEREQAAGELRALLGVTAGGAVTAPGGIAANGNVNIRAESGSIAAESVTHTGPESAMSLAPAAAASRLSSVSARPSTAATATVQGEAGMQV